MGDEDLQTIKLSQNLVLPLGNSLLTNDELKLCEDNSESWDFQSFEVNYLFLCFIYFEKLFLMFFLFKQNNQGNFAHEYTLIFFYFLIQRNTKLRYRLMSESQKFYLLFQSYKQQ